MEIGKISWGRHIKIVQIMFSPQALFVCFFLFFEPRFIYDSQAGLEFVILLPQFQE
jgi:hypothetical protein